MHQKTRVVFIGDSITDCGRNEDPEKLGFGYVRIIHDYFLTKYPERRFEFINRGISGDRIPDLAARWENDVLSLNPDYLSISIGINDVWRQLDRPEVEQVYPDRFEQIYIELLTQVREQTKAQIVLMEPTVIEENITSVGNQTLAEYVHIIHKLAESFQTMVVPTHQDFIQYLQANQEYKLTTDGVHMNSAGNMLMATTWIKSVEKLIVQ